MRSLCSSVLSPCEGVLSGYNGAVIAYGRLEKAALLKV